MRIDERVSGVFMTFSAKLDAPAVAGLLQEFGRRTALRGGNPYRAKAYTRAAENLLALTEPLEDVVAQGRLQEIQGVGDAVLYRARGHSADGSSFVSPDCLPRPARPPPFIGQRNPADESRSAASLPATFLVGSNNVILLSSEY
jgi:hypothetical protein